MDVRANHVSVTSPRALCKKLYLYIYIYIYIYNIWPILVQSINVLHLPVSKVLISFFFLIFQFDSFLTLIPFSPIPVVNSCIHEFRGVPFFLLLRDGHHFKKIYYYYLISIESWRYEQLARKSHTNIIVALQSFILLIPNATTAVPSLASTQCNSIQCHSSYF